MKQFLKTLPIVLLFTVAIVLLGAKVSSYTRDTAPTADDLLYSVNDPEGTPASRSVTFADALKGMDGSQLTTGTTGTGNVVKETSPTIITPTIASLENAGHSHQDAAGGGLLSTDALGSGTLPLLRGGTGTTTGTGTGSVVLSSAPTIDTPSIASFENAKHTHENAASGGTLSTDAIASGTLPVARGGTGTTTSTGSGNVVLSSSPTIVTPNIASMTNAQHDHQSAAGGGALSADAITTGTLPVLRGGTGTTTATGSGDVVLSSSPTITTPTIASFVNSSHTHLNAAGGGTLDAAAIGSGTLPVARGGTGVTVSTGTVAVVLSTAPALVAPTVSTSGNSVIPLSVNGLTGQTSNIVEFKKNNVVTARVTKDGYFSSYKSTAGPRSERFGDGAGASMNDSSGKGSEAVGNTAFGYNALALATTTNNNTAVGSLALSELVGAGSGQGNVAVGANSMKTANGGGFSTAVGFGALENSISGSTNVAVGAQALQGGTAGDGNVAVGNAAGLNGNYTDSVFVGSGAGSNTVIDSVSIRNVMVGRNAGDSLTTGSSNVTLGYNTGKSLVTGSGNVMLGTQAGENETGSDKLYIENSNSATPLIGGDFSADTVTISGALTANTINTGNGAVELASGTYTPTLTNVANLDASTAFACQYTRVGNVVTVSGKVSVDPTAGAATQLGISLPIASDVSANEKVAGTSNASAIAGQSAAVLGDATNNRAQMEWIASDVTNQPMYFSFTYSIE